ncbi:MmgE/PrpD family protein [Chitinasiproducens palmae]|uniref:2-methylcitrate dehydratase PrpD n=1 Tax=Chitinasiproducens palmae TaxID=1770053 RepID=A0A1H2PJK8_9BURK|nr:MmgE/PrpD family protein [Chitinasiproducens palmae]SDV46522.1 2-methylcitrate dehydratase PrpD [Chitinasiproducens palmae]
MHYLDTLGAFAADLHYAALPQPVRQQLAWVLVDTLGAIVGGSGEPELRAMAQGVCHGEGATFIGLGMAGSPMEAALINGTAGTFLEMDEGNRFSRGHPAIHVLPAVLALSEAQGADAHRFLSGLAVGYEIGSRFGASAQLRDAMHVHGTWGTLGAAAGSAHLFGADANRIRESVNVASSMSIATSKKTMLQGGLVRNVYAGLSNSNGLLAAQLVLCGFQGEADGPASLFGEIVSERFDQATLLRGLGDEWHVMQNYFKLHSCCRYNHGTLDALDVLAARGTLPAAAEISSVAVTTYSYAAELTDPSPRNTLGAKFSVPFAVATRIVNGSSGLSSFTGEAIRNPEVLALAAKVSVTEDPSMTARLPQERPARVRVVDSKGQVHEAEVGVNRGDDASPYTTQELSSKFLDLCERVWPRSHADAVLDSTLALGDAKAGDAASFQNWLQMLRRPADR